MEVAHHERIKNKIKPYVWIPAYSMVLLIGVESLARLNPLSGLIAILTNPLVFLINGLVIMAIFYIGMNLFKNKYVASSLVLLITIILGVITYIKYTYRGTGASLTDFSVIKEGLNMTHVLPPEFFVKTTLILLVLVGLSIYMMKKMTLPHPSIPKRILGISLALIFLLPFYFFSPTVTHKKTAKELGAYFYLIAQFDTTSEAQNHKIAENDEDLKEEIEKTFDPTLSHLNKGEVAISKPDIVYIQSESFFDPTETLGLENFSEDPLPFYHQLKQESDAFKVTSPAYGGDTVNAEFETLTGMSLTFFPKETNVFVSYLSKPVVSLGSVLRENGYYTLSLHPYTGAFYNRNLAYNHLGFNQFDSVETMKAEDPEFDKRAYSYPQSIYASDGELTHQIKKNLENNQKRNNFIFAISVQTHTPFQGNQNKKYDVTYRGNPQLKKPSLDEFNGYLRNLKETDDGLKDLITYLKNREKETWVVFYGDHQPKLDVFPYSEVLSSEERQARYEVPALIWNNKKNLTTTETRIDMTLLGEKGISTIGLETPNYFYLLKQLREVDQVESFNRDYVIQGGLYYLRDTPEYNEVYRKYYLMYKDILEGKFYIEKESKKWLIEKNTDYKGPVTRIKGG